MGALTLNNDKRVLSIDRFRGFALALMIIFGASKYITVSDFFAGLSTHDLSYATLVFPGIGFYDLIAPLFVFACGLSTGLSAQKTVSPFLRIKKALSLIGLGAVFTFSANSPVCFVFLASSILVFVLAVLWLLSYKVSALDRRIIANFLRFFLPILGLFTIVTALVETAIYLVGGSASPSHWGVLGSIGLATLICLPIAKSSLVVKCAFTTTYSAIYLTCCFLIPQDAFLYFTHGGILGAFGYGIIFAIALIVLDLRKYSHVAYSSLGIILLTAGILISEIIVPSKNAVNISYVFITSAMSVLVFAFFECFNLVKTKYSPLTDAGKNSLLLYLTHLILFVPMGTVINALVGLIPISGGLIVLVTFLGLIGYFLLLSYAVKKLNKKGFYLKI